jgi:hypothetical protein
MINDPFELTHPPSLEDSEVYEDEPVDYHDRFWDDISLGGRQVGHEPPIYTQVCRFDTEGNHVEMARGCPHYDASDEEGPRVSPGWTVQSNRR